MKKAASSSDSSGKARRRQVEHLRRVLLAWYDENRRDLPWRRTRDPYAIWISEIMLQQTRVAAALGHYKVFLQKFPDVGCLAAASEDDVLASWSGLGYYRRARMLHRCAKEIVERGSEFPETAEALRELPGIGRYTAAAVASIAFGECVAVVDGNVERVLQRLDGRSLTIEQTWKRAQELMSDSRPGDFNQAMMELGATVCLPRDPKCLLCPLRRWCRTKGEAPREKATSPQKNVEVWCALDRRNGNLRLVKRPKTSSLMSGMWELPQCQKAPENGAERWKTFRHSITVTNYTVHVLKGPASAARGRWIPIEKIPRLPITGLTRKILKADGII